MSSLIICNLRLGGHRTSVRLEGAMWDALNKIADRESTSINQICTWVDGHRAETEFTSSLRVFILNYFRRAARGDAPDFARTPEVHPSL
jgi:predicted DNA-binding ribbon-helix-helix protein